MSKQWVGSELYFQKHAPIPPYFWLDHASFLLFRVFKVTAKMWLTSVPIVFAVFKIHSGFFHEFITSSFFWGLGCLLQPYGVLLEHRICGGREASLLGITARADKSSSPSTLSLFPVFQKKLYASCKLISNLFFLRIIWERSRIFFSPYSQLVEMLLIYE